MTSSVNTNLSALIALRTLRSTQHEIAVVQKRISTGYRVADAFDNGAIFAVAQRIRNDIAGVSAVNSQLQGSVGLVSVAAASLTQASNLMTQVRDILTRLADQSISSDTRNQLSTQYIALISTIGSNLGTAIYNGTNLVGTSGSVGVIQDVLGNQLVFQGQSSTVGTVLTNLSVGAATSVTSAGTFLLQTFLTELNLVATSLNNVGALNQRIANQIDFNTSIKDAMTTGLSSLVDTDLAADSALLQSLRIKLQLGVQALAIANQSQQLLLTLFQPLQRPGVRAGFGVNRFR
jgi:flagellin